MGLLHTANHLGLIQACYPAKAALTPVSDVKPDSNALSKLCFYAAGRPKKLPKVAAALEERAERASRSPSNAKARVELALTLDVMRALVVECSAELQCFAHHALKVAELGLGRKPTGKQDCEIEARAAGVFHAVSVYLSGPFMGLNDALADQYLRCLCLLSSMAQLGDSDSCSRWIALEALDGAASSELLYSSSSDYEGQIRQIVPALLHNCSELDSAQLNQEFSNCESQASILAISAPKAAPITAPSPPPPLRKLASQAILILRKVIHQSHAGQLSHKLSAATTWLDTHGKGEKWTDSRFVFWLGASGIAASAIQYRATIVAWWAEQVYQISRETSPRTPKARTLVQTLDSLLRGPTSLVGLATASVLQQLTSLLLRLVSVDGNDPLIPDILSTISALATRFYYFDQLNDVVSELIEVIQAVRNGDNPATGLDTTQRDRALLVLVEALQGVLAEARLSDNDVETAAPAATQEGREAHANETAEALATTQRPTLEGTETVRGNGILIGSGEGLRSKKETNGHSPRRVQPGTGVGMRHRVSSIAFQSSLILLTETNSEVRAKYAEALLVFVSDELDIAIDDSKGADGEGRTAENQLDPWRDSTQFLGELHATIFELAVASDVASPSSSPPISAYPHPDPVALLKGEQRSRQSLLNSRRRSISPAATLPTPTLEDFLAFATIVAAVQGRGSAIATLVGVPMLLALDRYASSPDAGASGETAPSMQTDESTARAPRDVAFSGLTAAASSWQAALPPRSSPDWTASVVDVFSSSSLLQAASGMDRTTLEASLATPWSPAIARARCNPPEIYKTSSSLYRSVTNLSNQRTPDRARSFRTPSVADLQTSLGQNSNLHGSATPSIASTNGTEATQDTRRRTSKTKTSSLLQSLTQTRDASGSRVSVIDRSSRLSVARPLAT